MITNQKKQKIYLKRANKHILTVPDEEIEEDKHQNHCKYLFNSLFKEYEKIVKEMGVQHNHVEVEIVERILLKMCYLQTGKLYDSQKKISQISDILKSPTYGITLSNLFKFILLIQNVGYEEKWFGQSLKNTTILNDDKRDKPIGGFNSQGDWFLQDHQKLGIKNLFQDMYLNRLTRKRVQTYQDESINQQYSHSPQILTKSRVLAEKQRNKMRSFSKTNLLKSNSHQQLLIMCKTMKQHNIKLIAMKLQQEQKKRCTFQPKVNQRKKSIDQPKNRCLYLFNKSKQSMNSQNQTSIDQKQNDSNYKPNKISHKKSLSCLSHTSALSNSRTSQQKSKPSQHSRKKSTTIQQPTNPSLISTFFKSLKQQNTKTNPPPPFPFKKPLLTINIQISEFPSQNIDIFLNQSLTKIAQRILINNKLPHDFLKSIQSILQQEIERNSSIKIKNGIIVSQ